MKDFAYNMLVIFDLAGLTFKWMPILWSFFMNVFGAVGELTGFFTVNLETRIYCFILLEIYAVIGDVDIHWQMCRKFGDDYYSRIDIDEENDYEDS